MQKKLQNIMMIVAFGAIFGCASVNFAQTRMPMVGGYKTVSVGDAKVVEAAEFAVSAYSEKNEVSLEIVEIQKAERQVVQGMNYRICVQVKVAEEDNDETQFVLLTVYQNLKRAYKVTSWKPDACPIVGR